MKLPPTSIAKSGFTLIEVITGLAIIALVSSLGLAGWQSFARYQAEADFNNLETSIRAARATAVHSSSTAEYAGIVFDVDGNTLADTSSDIVNGFWNYVTARRSSGNLEVFINGIRSNFIVSTSNGFIDADRWRIGTTNASGDFANCNISQVQFYNRSLTAQEIIQNYNATKSRYGY
jgi:prepilin-type N-terminal cleavage/methylation domain-containing protein